MKLKSWQKLIESRFSKYELDKIEEEVDREIEERRANAPINLVQDLLLMKPIHNFLGPCTHTCCVKDSNIPL